jgi:MFS family permease
MRAYAVVWLGQSVSLVGSGLTSFALGVWVFEQSRSATMFALMGLCAVLPRLLLSPLAGALVDRWDRRWLMIGSDVGAGLVTLAVAILRAADKLEIWHVWLMVGASAAFGAIQWPAYTAATTQFVSKQDLGRANGMRQLGQAAAEILAPSLAVALTPSLGLEGVILIDLATFAFAVLTLALVRFPSLGTAPSASGSLREEMLAGGKYIAARPGLVGLLLLLSTVNFLWGMVGALITPMVLGFTTSAQLGAIVSIAGAGMLAGSLTMSIWGGPRRRILGVFAFEALSGLCFMLMGLRPLFWTTAAGAFGAHVTIAIVFGSNQTIWQSKVEHQLQGRVFAAQQMLMRAASPLAYLLAGPAADRLFEPLLATDGRLSGSVGRLVGTGPGRGIGLLFLIMGVIKLSVVLLGYLRPSIRLIEEQLPDAID